MWWILSGLCFLLIHTHWHLPDHFLLIFLHRGLSCDRWHLQLHFVLSLLYPLAGRIRAVLFLVVHFFQWSVAWVMICMWQEEKALFCGAVLSKGDSCRFIWRCWFLAPGLDSFGCFYLGSRPLPYNRGRQLSVWFPSLPCFIVHEVLTLVSCMFVFIWIYLS